jgi:hypothetical protein
MVAVPLREEQTSLYYSGNEINRISTRTATVDIFFVGSEKLVGQQGLLWVDRQLMADRVLAYHTLLPR